MRCKAITKKGTKCSYNKNDAYGDYCTFHKNKYYESKNNKSGKGSNKKVMVKVTPIQVPSIPKPLTPQIYNSIMSGAQLPISVTHSVISSAIKGNKIGSSSSSSSGSGVSSDDLCDDLDKKMNLNDDDKNKKITKYLVKVNKYQNYYEHGTSYYIKDIYNNTALFYKRSIFKKINEMKKCDEHKFKVNGFDFTFIKDKMILIDGDCESKKSQGNVNKIIDATCDIIGYQRSPNNICRNVYLYNITRNYDSDLNDKKLITDYLDLDSKEFDNEEFKKHVLNRFNYSPALIDNSMSVMKNINKNKKRKLEMINNEFQRVIFKAFVDNNKDCKIKIMFHGTRPEAYANISNEHFNPSYSSAGLCGSGIYLSYSAYYSYDFVKRYLKLPSTSMLICAVAYNNEIHRNDLNDIKQRGINYDSVKFNHGGAGMKCIPNAYQILPLYKISY